MNKFVFEMYEFCETKGRIFKGYKTIVAESSEQAWLSAQEALPINYKLEQIYIPQ